jgi:NTP pyrophosphatase (non-canonical NTP hydrolase)
VADASPAVQVHILQSAPFPSPPVTIPSIPIETFQWRSTTAPPVATAQELIPRLDRWLSLAAHPQPSAATSAATLQPGQKTVPSAPETAVEQKTVGEQVAEEMVRLHEASSEGRQAASDYADFAVSNAGLVARSLLSLSAETQALKRTAADSSRTLNAPAGQVLRQMAERAAKTAIYPGAGTGDFAARVYTALALAGEAGEVAGKASKTLRDGATPDLVARLHAELGDTFWHWLMACQEWGADPDAVVAQMFSRLQDRQERGVLAGSGDVR